MSRRKQAKPQHLKSDEELPAEVLSEQENTNFSEPLDYFIQGKGDLRSSEQEFSLGGEKEVGIKGFGIILNELYNFSI
uniref:Uncharacterized protein n=1 Tax=Sphaerodactylus townsendi TaxID=933632 RepID=A0ACB8FCF2_9SAUR